MDKRIRELPNRLQHCLAQKRVRYLILGIGFGLIALLFFSNQLGKQTESSESVQKAEEGESTEEYAEKLENALTALLEQIQGAGQVKVMVTIAQGAEQVYAEEEKTSRQITADQSEESAQKKQEQDSTETNYLVVKGADGSQQVVAVTQVEPVIKGVVVVCDGAGNAVVEQQITDAVTTALDLSSAKVCVVQSR